MANITPNEDFIKRNYEKTISLIRTVCGADSPMLKMFEELGDRYAICPASSHADYYSAFPGGLCYHNLHVLQWVGRFASLLDPDKQYSKETLLKISFLSEVGKVGNETKDLYVPTKEDWKKKHGQYYDVNSDIEYMRTNQRSLYMASRYGISLTEDEYLAILLADGQSENANAAYRYKEPKLSLILQYANSWSQKLEKSNTILW